MDQKLKQDISIGITIRELRIERHMTQEQVATKLQLLNLDITRSVYIISHLLLSDCLNTKI